MARPNRKVLTAAEEKVAKRQEEIRRMQEYVADMIKRGEAKAFMVKHGFATPSGKLTRRYGG